MRRPSHILAADSERLQRDEHLEPSFDRVLWGQWRPDRDEPTADGLIRSPCSGPLSWERAGPDRLIIWVAPHLSSRGGPGTAGRLPSKLKAGRRTRLIGRPPTDCAIITNYAHFADPYAARGFDVHISGAK